MGESDVRGKADEEQGRPLPAAGQSDTGSVAEPAKRKADDEWLELATGDPAFFIKPSDTV